MSLFDDSNPYEDIEGENSQSNIEVKGITDEVTQQVTAELTYPCFILPSDLEITDSTMRVLSRTFTSISETTVNVYLDMDGDIYLIGGLLPDSVDSFLQILPQSKKISAYLSRDRKLSPAHFLALS